MPGQLTEITEIATAVGMLLQSIGELSEHAPKELVGVSEVSWNRFVTEFANGTRMAEFQTAFDNGKAFLGATEGLRNRSPLRVEWKGPHSPPGDDVIPADLRIDHVFLVSCKYQSKVLLNSSPTRLFERLLVREERSSANWFYSTAPREFDALFLAAKSHLGLSTLPNAVNRLARNEQQVLKTGLSERLWPVELQPFWADLCEAVANESSRRWALSMSTDRDRLRLFWRILRITTAAYFVLGVDKKAHLRLRIDSAWDWAQRFDLRSFEVSARAAGQPEVAWVANILDRSSGWDAELTGHVEIRWSHGRFFGVPEAKVYLDSALSDVPGFNELV